MQTPLLASVLGAGKGDSVSRHQALLSGEGNDPMAEDPQPQAGCRSGSYYGSKADGDPVLRHQMARSRFCLDAVGTKGHPLNVFAAVGLSDTWMFS